MPPQELFAIAHFPLVLHENAAAAAARLHAVGPKAPVDAVHLADPGSLDGSENPWNRQLSALNFRRDRISAHIGNHRPQP